MSGTVAVVGGGYGGAALAKTLDAQADVVLVDPRDAFINTVGSLRGLARPDWAENMFFPFDTIVRRGRVVRERAVSVDSGGVTVGSGRRVEADVIVLATGSSYAFPAKPKSDATDAVVEDLRRTHKELAGAERVLIAGAGPVGLELAGEIRAEWPDKHVTIVDPVDGLLSPFRPDVRRDLLRQLDELGIHLRLGTRLSGPPATEPAQADSFTVTTTAGDRLGADIWFRAHGVHVNSGYLTDGRLTTLTAQGQVPVTPALNVVGHDHVYAIGDLTDVAEPKMAAYAMRHAEVVAANVTARLRGEPATATYQPSPDPAILLPLGPRHGVGQLPTPDGPHVMSADAVSDYKGRDLFTARFTAQFGEAA